MFEIISVVLLLISVCVNSQLNYYDTSTLVYAHVLFRHGDRTPDNSCKSLLGNISYYPEGYGGLTLMGKNKEFNIGQRLRDRYGSFLGDTYYDGLVEAISTNISRTMMSLELVLAGLFPPSNEQTWNWQLNWQPIPYNTVPINNDMVLGYQYYYCTNYIQRFNVMYNTPAVQAYINQIYVKNITNFIGNSTSFKISSKPIENTYALYNCLVALEQTYQPLPDWRISVYPGPMKTIAIMQYILQTYTDELVQFAGGPFVKKILQDSESKISGYLPARKLSLYSAHEYNIAQVLRALKVFTPAIFPNYGSYVIIELHKVLGEYGLKIFRQNYDNSLPKLMSIPGCGTFCTLAKFKETMSARMPPDELKC